MVVVVEVVIEVVTVIVVVSCSNSRGSSALFREYLTWVWLSSGGTSKIGRPGG